MFGHFITVQTAAKEDIWAFLMHSEDNSFFVEKEDMSLKKRTHGKPVYFAFLPA